MQEGVLAVLQAQVGLTPHGVHTALRQVLCHANTLSAAAAPDCPVQLSTCSTQHVKSAHAV